MKTLNETRSTNKFSILSGEIKNMTKIVDHFEGLREDNDVVGIANENAVDEYDRPQYIVRVDNDDKMVDYLVEVGISTLTKNAVRILDQTEIRTWK